MDKSCISLGIFFFILNHQHQMLKMQTLFYPPTEQISLSHLIITLYHYISVLFVCAFHINPLIFPLFKMSSGFLFVCLFLVTTGGSQDFLLALYQDHIWKALGTMLGTGDQTHIGHIQDTYPPHCTITM